MSSDEPSSTVAADAYAALDRYAERSLQAIDRSEIVPEMPARLVRRGIYLIAAAVVLTFALLYLGKVHVVVTANGKVVPERDAIALQAPGGGVVRSILARPGDQLAAGAPIVQLDAPQSAVDLASLKGIHQLQQTELQSARASLAEIDRLLANPNAAAGRPAEARPVPSAGIMALEIARLALEIARQNVQRLPELRRLHTREIELMRDSVTLNEKSRAAQARVLDDDEQALAAQLSRLASRRALAAKDRTPLEPGAEEERYRDAERGLLASRLRFAQQAVDLSNQKLRQAELEIKLAALAPGAVGSLRQAELAYRHSLSGLVEERQALSNRIEKLATGSVAAAATIAQGAGGPALATIAMPAAGTLLELKVSNPGERIAVGTVVAVVTPADVPLAIEAIIPNKDVGFVTPGLEARIKVDAYPYQQFGTARAEVQRVLPNAGPDNSFRVRLRVLDDRVGGGAHAPRLFPGLTVVAEIQTTKQRLLDLLFSKGPEAGPK